jgi:hypothetical protein
MPPAMVSQTPMPLVALKKRPVDHQRGWDEAVTEGAR